ncbi:hypothetical protein FRC09_001213, partial [Ceratobasidium sp. 395]
MRWIVVLALVAGAFATSVVPVGFGSLYHRRLKRTNGRRVDGTCKPRPTGLPAPTSSMVMPGLPTLLPTMSSTPAAPAPATSTRPSTPTTGPAPQVAGLLAKVLPLGLGKSTNSWTTVQNYGADSAYPLADTGNTLRPVRVLGGLLPAVSSAPDGKQSIEVFFSKGSYAFMGTPGGISFYAYVMFLQLFFWATGLMFFLSYGPSDLTRATELTFGYSIMFEEGFDFVRGGKLPGLYGGDSDDNAFGCSGGRYDLGCFSTRFMWREDGAGELYTYLPKLPANEALCSKASIPGRTICGEDYGTSFGRGSFYFKAGQWNTVAQRIKLNTPGVANGELE